MDQNKSPFCFYFYVVFTYLQLLLRLDFVSLANVSRGKKELNYQRFCGTLESWTEGRIDDKFDLWRPGGSLPAFELGELGPFECTFVEAAVLAAGPRPGLLKTPPHPSLPLSQRLCPVTDQEHRPASIIAEKPHLCPVTDSQASTATVLLCILQGSFSSHICLAPLGPRPHHRIAPSSLLAGKTRSAVSTAAAVHGVLSVGDCSARVATQSTEVVRPLRSTHLLSLYT